MAFEARQALAHERLTADGQLGSRLRARLEGGNDITLDDYLAMQHSVAALRTGAGQLFDGVGALIYPEADGEAEEGLAYLGSPRFGALWTLLHLPTVAVPLENWPGGLPWGAQLLGRSERDIALLQMAERACASGY